MKITARSFLRVFVLTVMFCVPKLAYGQEEQIWIDLYSPHEGETFYAGPSTILYSMQVSGYVRGVEDPDSVVVELQILQSTQVIATRQTTLDYDSYFQFDATVNPGASNGSFTPVEVEAGCETCHHTADLVLPTGPVVVRVTAEVVDGRIAQAERQVVIDRSEYVDLPVEVVNTDNGSNLLPGVEVEASARMYDWRARHVSATSDGSGTAWMRLESLSNSPTRYTVEIAPTRIQGVLYQGVEPVEVILSPGITEISPIQISARAQSSYLMGRLFEVGDVSGANMEIWAIRLSNSQSFQTRTDSNGEFTFSSLPIDRFYVGPDPLEIARLGLQIEGDVVDLVDEHSRSMMLMVQRSPAVLLEGSVLDEMGDPLPFAQVAFNGHWKELRVMPSTKTWMFYSVAPQSMSLTASAPGYISWQFELEDTGSIAGNVELTLSPNPETQRIPFGEGEMVIPLETEARFSDKSIEIDSGWLWGIGSSGTVLARAAEIELDGATFALEILPDEKSRLYVYAGSAHMAVEHTENGIDIGAGDMIDFSGKDDWLPVPMGPTIDHIDAADPRFSLATVRAEDETATASETAGRVAIGAAQLVTLITYYSVLLLLIGSPFIALYFWRRRAK